MSAGDGNYRRNLKRYPVETARFCDSLRERLASLDTGDIRMKMEKLIKEDSVLLAQWQRYGTDIHWNAKDSILTVEFDDLLWGDGLQYDFSAGGKQLKRRFYKHFRLRKINRRLYYQRVYTPIMSVIS